MNRNGNLSIAKVEISDYLQGYWADWAQILCSRILLCPIVCGAAEERKKSQNKDTLSNYILTFYNAVMRQQGVDGLANSVDPGGTVRSGSVLFAKTYLSQ